MVDGAFGYGLSINKRKKVVGVRRAVSWKKGTDGVLRRMQECRSGATHFEASDNTDLLLSNRQRNNIIDLIIEN